MTTLFINDEHCFNINQLEQYFELPIKYGSPLFKDILDYGRAGDIAKWLREHNENNLADSVALIGEDMGDGEYMSCISDIITGKKVSSSKPEFSKLFSIEDIKVDELENETVVCIFLKVMRIINESYRLKICSSWGTRANDINPIDFKKGLVIKQEFRYIKRPRPITKIELYADDVKLKSFRDTLIFQVEDYEFKMIFVEHGEFEMRKGKENSKVVLTDDYYIGEIPVTQKLWKLIMNSNPSTNDWNGDNKPVESINVEDCLDFLKKINKKLEPVLLHKKFRLPTEAEWEFAALGGNASKHYAYSGSNDIIEVGWCKKNSKGMTCDVAKLRPNELGLFDMSGNVSEWCEDLYCYGCHVVKGGFYDSPTYKCKVTSRDSCCGANCTVGLRLCIS